MVEMLTLGLIYTPIPKQEKGGVQALNPRLNKVTGEHSLARHKAVH